MDVSANVYCSVTTLQASNRASSTRKHHPPPYTAHTPASQERDQQDGAVLVQKMNGLRMSHTRRTAAMDAAQGTRVVALREKCVAEIEELKGKQKAEYDVLVSARKPEW